MAIKRVQGVQGLSEQIIKSASSIKSVGSFLAFIIEYKVKTVGCKYKYADFSQRLFLLKNLIEKINIHRRMKTNHRYQMVIFSSFQLF